MKQAALSLFVIAASGAYVWSQWGGGVADDLLAAPAESADILTGTIPQGIPASAASAPPLRPQPVPFVVNEPARPTDVKPEQDASLPPPPPAEPPPLSAPAAEAGTSALSEPPPLPAPADNAPAVASDPPPLPTAPAAPTAVTVDIPIPRPRPARHQPTPARSPERPLVTPAAMRVVAHSGYADGVYTGPLVDAYYGLIQIQAVVQSGRLIGIKVLRYPNDRMTSIYINRQALPMLRDEVVSAQSANVDIISGATLTSEAFIRSLGGALNKAGS